MPRGGLQLQTLQARDSRPEPAGEPAVSIRLTPIGCEGVSGPATVTRFRRALQDTGTVVWNGPMGVVEQSPVAWGTEEGQPLSGVAALSDMDFHSASVL
jgi:hypothetical protein